MEFPRFISPRSCHGPSWLAWPTFACRRWIQRGFKFEAPLVLAIYNGMTLRLMSWTWT